MSSGLLKKYPPYEGSEPYLYYCFSEDDSDRAEELLKRLWQRGVRVWYCIGKTDDLKTANGRHERMKGAGLVVAYASGNLQRDSVKRNLMFLQSNGTPVVAVDGEEVSNLSLGLREQTPHIRALKGIDYDTESELISCADFSRDFIGAPPKPGLSKGMKALLAFVIALAAAAVVFFALSFTGVISSPVAPATPPEEVTVLRLKELPAVPAELNDYPNLEKLIVPQSLVTEEADVLLRELAKNYTLVIDRGA